MNVEQCFHVNGFNVILDLTREREGREENTLEKLKPRKKIPQNVKTKQTRKRT